MLQRLLNAVFTKLDCSIFSLMFLLFRWREAYFNGTGRWIFKKTGVRKTTVIASIMFLTELVLFFTEMIPEHSLPGSAHTRAIPSVARPIFVARMKVYVMTILNHMLSSFRSKNWRVWTTLNEMAYYRTWVSFLPNTGAFPVSHGQASLPGRKYISRPSRIACSLVLDPKINSPGQF